jgi:hypothetical protein
MQSAQLMFHKRPRIALSIRDLGDFVFALPKCVDCYRNADRPWALAAQYGLLIALINQFSTLFEQSLAAFAPFAVARDASCGTSSLRSRWWGWS